MFENLRQKIADAQPTDPAAKDLSMAVSFMIAGPIAVFMEAELLIHTLGFITAMAGVAIGGTGALVRTGIYLDSYAHQRNASGDGTAFTRQFDRFSRAIGLRRLSRWKIEGDREFEKLRKHMDVLDKRIIQAADEEKKAHQRDRHHYRMILAQIKPGRNLAIASLTGLGSVRAGVGLVGAAIKGLSLFSFPFRLAAVGLFSLYSASSLAVYAKKKAMAGASTPFLDRFHSLVEKTPLGGLARRHLGFTVTALDTID